MDDVLTPLERNIKTYLGGAVAGELIEALAKLALARPADPALFLAHHFLSLSPAAAGGALAITAATPDAVAALRASVDAFAAHSSSSGGGGVGGGGEEEVSAPPTPATAGAAARGAGASAAATVVSTAAPSRGSTSGLPPLTPSRSGTRHGGAL